MPHPLSHKCPIPISPLCLTSHFMCVQFFHIVSIDVPAGVGAPPLNTTSGKSQNSLVPSLHFLTCLFTVLTCLFTFLTCLSISPYRDRNREPRTLPIFDEKRHPLTVSIFKEQFSYSHFRPKDNFQIYLQQILSLHEVLRYMYVHISTWFMEERSMTSYKRPIISS